MNDFNNPARHHVVERTSPKKKPFVGKCVYCGAENLSIKGALLMCNAAQKRTVGQSIIDAIEGLK